MNKLRVVSLAVCLLSAACSWAASPTQVGAYVGTLKITYFFDGGKTVSKSQLLLNVSADDSTTFTVNGTQWTTVNRYYNSTDGVAVLRDPGEDPNNDIFLSVFNFKGNTVKGSITGVVNSTTPITFIRSVEGKFRLKKLN